MTLALALLALAPVLSQAGQPGLAIEGNHSFSARRIRRVAALKITNDALEPDSMEAAAQRVASFYRSRGYINSRVEYLAGEGGGPADSIRLIIAEGEQVLLDSLTFSGNHQLQDRLLARSLSHRPGRPLNPEVLGQDDLNLMMLYADHGFIFAEVEHDLEYRNGNQANLRYRVSEGRQVNFSNISIQGGQRVREEFVLKQLTIRPGDRFSRRELIHSRYRLMRTDLFRRVEVSPGELAADREQIAVRVELEEKPPRLWEAGIGYGSGDAVRLMGRWGHRNLFGMGRKLEYDGLASFRTKLPLQMIRGRSQLAYSDPAFRMADHQLRSEVFYDDFRPSYTDYRLETVGWSLWLGVPWSPHFNMDYRWRLEWLKLSPNWQITNYTSDTIGYRGRRSFSVLAGYEHLDDPVSPRDGGSWDLEAEYVGGLLGGSQTFQRVNATWLQYLSLSPRRFYLSGRLKYGVVGDWSERADLPPYELYFLGGPSTVRGYPQNSIGPADYRGLATGGRIMTLANLQLNYRLGRSWWAAAFLDGGMISSRPFARQSLDELVSSPGLGARYNLPFGTARVDFAAPTSLAGQIRHWRWMLAWGEAF